MEMPWPKSYSSVKERHAEIDSTVFGISVEATTRDRAVVGVDGGDRDLEHFP